MYPIPTHVFNPDVDPLNVNVCPAATTSILFKYMENKDVTKLIDDYHAYLGELRDTYKWDDNKIDRVYLPMVL